MPSDEDLHIPELPQHCPHFVKGKHWWSAARCKAADLEVKIDKQMSRSLCLTGKHETCPFFRRKKAGGSARPDQ